LRFPVFELREGLAWIAHVVELEQVNLRGLEPSQRALELRRVGLLDDTEVGRIRAARLAWLSA